MNYEINITGDGSKTIYLPDLDETYHSSHGAFQEAVHVFIDHGVRYCKNENLRVFEMGFGTGLNALLTLIHSENDSQSIEYSGIEAFPVPIEIVEKMEYESQVGVEWKGPLLKLHQVSWNEFHKFNDKFTFRKIQSKIEECVLEQAYYDLIFFDAFGPRVQSDLWKLPILEKLYSCLKKGGVLVTYCAMGQFKRDLKSLGFVVESLPGPPGKREMTRAVKV